MMSTLHKSVMVLCMAGFGMLLPVRPNFAQNPQHAIEGDTIGVGRFRDSAHHWEDITDHHQVIGRLPDQKRYAPDQIKGIADNILLYQLDNGGWPKNYDMRAILTDQQKQKLKENKHTLHAGFDNGATHSQVAYLARAYTKTGDPDYKSAAIRGLNYIFRAQYDNGGWPQFYPDTSGYHKFITFNDGAMVGVMKILRDIVQDSPNYSFLDSFIRKEAQKSFAKGIDCILKMQIKEHGKLTVWCQQHDNKTLKPTHARTYELPSKASAESTEIVQLLMSLNDPSEEVIRAINGAVDWFNKSAIEGVRVKRVNAKDTTYEYHSTESDKKVVHDPDAPRIWARFYELDTNRPLFANRNGHRVYSLSEVARERRTGYGWYGYWPQKMLEQGYPKWKKRIE